MDTLVAPRTARFLLGKSLENWAVGEAKAPKAQGGGEIPDAKRGISD